MTLPAASLTLFGLPRNASRTEAIVAAAASLARAGDPLLASRNTPRERLLNPLNTAESNLTFGYGDN